MSILRKAVVLSNVVTIALLALLCIGMVAHLFVVQIDDEGNFVSSTSRELKETSGGASCANDEDCGGFERGQCNFGNNNETTTGVCRCRSDYSKPDCSYKRKSQLTAFLLSFFVGGFGADRFYLGYIGLGVGKLILTLFNCCVSLSFRVFNHKKSGKTKMGAMMLVTCLVCLVALGVLVWWMVDWILIVKGDVNDHKGYELKKDM